ncbi:hypothetical protein CTEN210_01021 [Chaetoceros tenuissimus]|uniref:Apple domain-containing protein n=1 Tax=Chaetoceros tenuissimus TaxID=426638 RepID=A0AAD3CEB8_9STRA|nr:hypothetical protein CTEN210_01021 [Chaetoceros tenuissimus]
MTRIKAYLHILSWLSLLHFIQATNLTSNPEGSPQNLTPQFCNGTPRDDCEVELDVPAACAGISNCPIVFFLHGALNHNDNYKHSTDVHAANYIGIYPQGEKGWNTWPKSWNQCSYNDYNCSQDPNESRFFIALIEYIRDRGALGNIYIVGTSNGGSMAHKLASNAGPHLPIKGIVSKVFQLLRIPERSFPGEYNWNQPSQARGTWPVSVLSIMGEDDRDIPYHGGYTALFNIQTDTYPYYQNFRGEFELMDALESMDTWATHNGCDGSYVTSTHSSDKGDRYAIRYDYDQGCPHGIHMQHYVIKGAKHEAQHAMIDDKPIDFEITYEFIERVEKLEQMVPSASPTNLPSPSPSRTPTMSPSKSPSKSPSVSPSFKPTKATNTPSFKPTIATATPTKTPSLRPSYIESTQPSTQPTYVREYMLYQESKCKGDIDWNQATKYKNIDSVETCQTRCSASSSCQSFQYNGNKQQCIVMNYKVDGHEVLGNPERICGVIESKSFNGATAPGIMKKSNKTMIVGIVAGCSGFIVIALAAIFIKRRRDSVDYEKDIDSYGTPVPMDGSLHLSEIEEMRRAQKEWKKQQQKADRRKQHDKYQKFQQGRQHEQFQFGQEVVGVFSIDADESQYSQEAIEVMSIDASTVEDDSGNAIVPRNKRKEKTVPDQFSIPSSRHANSHRERRGDQPSMSTNNRSSRHSASPRREQVPKESSKAPHAMEEKHRSSRKNATPQRERVTEEHKTNDKSKSLMHSMKEKYKSSRKSASPRRESIPQELHIGNDVVNVYSIDAEESEYSEEALEVVRMKSQRMPPESVKSSKKSLLDGNSRHIKSKSDVHSDELQKGRSKTSSKKKMKEESAKSNGNFKPSKTSGARPSKAVEQKSARESLDEMEQLKRQLQKEKMKNTERTPNSSKDKRSREKLEISKSGRHGRFMGREDTGPLKRRANDDGDRRVQEKKESPQSKRSSSRTKKEESRKEASKSAFSSSAKAQDKKESSPSKRSSSRMKKEESRQASKAASETNREKQESSPSKRSSSRMKKEESSKKVTKFAPSSNTEKKRDSKATSDSKRSNSRMKKDVRKEDTDRTSSSSNILEKKREQQRSSSRMKKEESREVSGSDNTKSKRRPKEKDMFDNSMVERQKSKRRNKNKRKEDEKVDTRPKVSKDLVPPTKPKKKNNSHGKDVDNQRKSRESGTSTKERSKSNPRKKRQVDNSIVEQIILAQQKKEEEFKKKKERSASNGRGGRQRSS